MSHGRCCADATLTVPVTMAAAVRSRAARVEVRQRTASMVFMVILAGRNRARSLGSRPTRAHRHPNRWKYAQVRYRVALPRSREVLCVLDVTVYYSVAPISTAG